VEIATMSLLGAFLIGLAHTFQPCEDKAIVAAFVAWATRKFFDAVPLVIIYGLGITIVNTFLGFIFAYAGVALERYETPLEIVSGIATIAFGLYMLSRFAHIHMGHHEEVSQPAGSPHPPSALGMLAFGMTRGVALCPVELAVLLWALSTGNVLRGTMMLFLFGLGTTIGLILVSLVMGGLAGLLLKTRYGVWLPRIAPAIMIIMGVLLVLSPFIGMEF